MSEGEKSLLATAKSTQVYAATLEFKLNWLESLLREGDSTLSRSERKLEAGLLLSLLETPEHCEDGLVHEIERALPTEGAGAAGLRMVRSWTIEEFAERLSARLTPMAERMADPDFAQAIFDAWGLPSTCCTLSPLEARTRLQTIAAIGSAGCPLPDLTDRSIVCGKLWWVDEPDNWAYVPERWAWDAWRFYHARANANTWGNFIASAGDLGEWLMETWNEYLRNWDRPYQVDEHDNFDGEHMASVEWDWDLGPTSAEGAMESHLPEEILEMAITREANVHGERFVQFDAGDHGVIVGKLRKLGYTVKEDQALVSGAVEQEGQRDPTEHLEYLRKKVTL